MYFPALTKLLAVIRTSTTRKTDRRSLAAKPRLYRPVSSAARLFGQALRIGPEVMAIAERAAAWPGVAALRLASETGERFSRSRDEHVEAICVRGTGLVGAEA